MKWLPAAGVLLLALATPQSSIRFHNVARQAGLVQSFPNGGATSKQFIVETTGSGAAFLDYDNDGLLDIFMVSANSTRRSRDWIPPWPAAIATLGNCAARAGSRHCVRTGDSSRCWRNTG